ncbi:MAG: ADP-forming succinate--CoA ligase subunit beta [Candidatus Stahlbacteria bacterium]|nr:ADP-forming succinate--CoA ligase subunit beta [Candidatus Stahlbacteria bacterium]
MKIHEYQAREIFSSYGIPVPEAKICTTPQKAKEISNLIGYPVVIKAQVQVGGRGKAGGIKIAKSPDEAMKIANDIFSMRIKDFPVEIIMVTEAINIKTELYVGVIIDRSSKRIAVMTSAAGGIEIEEVAQKTPEKINKIMIDPLSGIRSYHLHKLTTPLFTDNRTPITDNRKLCSECDNIINKLYHAFIENDCSLAEINPLVVTDKGKLLACDSKINIDDNALFRKELAGLRDTKADDPIEKEARESGLSYVSLKNGDVGCIVNGAGLAMTTMDLIKLYGGEPANFLDVGGSSSPDKVVSAMKIILTNKNVKSILINIFGGITRCDDIAVGLLESIRTMEIPHPIVVRLSGTNQEKAKEILAKTELHFVSSFTEGVKKAIELAK